jgi:hypothetical protein
MPRKPLLFSDDLKAVRTLRDLKARSEREYRDCCGTVARRFRERYARSELSAEVVAALEGIPGWIWVSAQARYADILQAVEEYASQYGLESVQGSTTHRGLPIGRWLLAQRSRHRRGTISTWLKIRLEGLPGFSTELISPQARQAKRSLQVARRKLDSLRRLFAGAHAPNAARRRWFLIDYFHRLHKRGQAPDEIRHGLEALPGWSWEKETTEERDRRFLAQLENLVGKRRSGMRELRQAGEERLASWLTGCRVRHRKGHLPRWLVRALDSIGEGGWLKPRPDVNRQNLSELRKFLRLNSLADLRMHRNTSSADLYRWVTRLRKLHQQGQRHAMDRELEALPGWTWDPRARRRAKIARAAGLPRSQAPKGPRKDAGATGTERDLAYIRIIAAYLSRRKGLGLGRVPVYKGVDLHWIATDFRNRYRLGTLPKKSVQGLERIPGWNWDPITERFEQTLAVVKRFVKAHGIDALTDTVVFEDVAIGKWMSSQRGQYREGQLTPKFRPRLETIPGFQAHKDRAAVMHRAHLERVDRYALALRDHYAGTKRLRATFTRGRDTLNINQIRDFFRKLRLNNTLPPKLRKELDRIPGFWRLPRSESRDLRLNLLRRLAARGGLPEIAYDEELDGVRLGVWVNFCCKQYRVGKLDPELAQQLESIPGWTWKPSREQQTERKLDLLRKFLEDRDYEDLFHHPRRNGVNLHAFVLGIRKRYHKGRLPDRLIRAFEKLTGWSWSPRQDASRAGRPPASRRRP